MPDTGGENQDSRFETEVADTHFRKKQSRQVIENKEGRPKIGQNKANLGLGRDRKQRGGLFDHGLAI